MPGSLIAVSVPARLITRWPGDRQTQHYRQKQRGHHTQQVLPSVNTAGSVVTAVTLSNHLRSQTAI